ncbi:MAG: hypothetical protein ACRDT7_13790 [Microbacterium sp.]
MRNKILIVLGVAFVAYVIGSRASKVQVNKRESVPHQLVRLWNEPKAKKARAKAAKKVARNAGDKARTLSKRLR